MYINKLIAGSLTLLASSMVIAAPKEVRIASHVSTLSPLHQQSQMFVDEIEKRLPGQFTFKLYPSGQLGKEKALITNVKAGSIEMVNVASGVLKLDKKLGIFDLPWLFDSREHVQRAMAGQLGEEVEARIEKKARVEVLGIYENGFRHVLNSSRSVKTPNDLKGLKIRVSGGKFRQDVFQKMGATPQKVSWKETFTALQTGVVDGAEAAVYGFYEQKQYEVAGYLSKTGHVYTPSFLMASQSFWKSLTDEQRKVFTEVGKEITGPAYSGAAALENQYLAEMEKLTKIDEVDLGAFQTATEKTKESYIKREGDDWLTLIQEAR
ncbi:TRAP transporter substrate-binding protein [Vibrio penaeicida]|uniref:TRAP transporter substrate-binding protein n=1 Tax=Vibrio penaeicida TaxID=104609 RepID=UPI000CEA56D8|nr:TRAP transporter substrate-binding protein [Vibrio penaeicida]